MDFVGRLRPGKKDLKAIVTKRPTERGDVESNGVLTDDQPLSPSSLLVHEPNINCHIIVIMGWKNRIDSNAFKTGIKNTMLMHPRFFSVPVVDEIKGMGMKWVRTKVDIENHVIIPDLGRNMDSPDQFVEDYVSDLSKTTMDMSKPLWEVHLLDVKTTEAESVGVFRIHHSLGDGVSLISLLLACTRKTADPELLPTIPARKEAVSRSPVQAVFRLVWNTLVDIWMFMATLMCLKDTETPIKGAPGVEFTPKRFVHRTVSLDDIKLVKNAMNTTINDVLLGITTAGLSRYLNRRYGDGVKDEKSNNLPKGIRLKTALMVNMRPSPGIQVMADMMKDKTEAKWGNCVSYILFPFTIALRDDPLDYVHEMKVTVDRKKHSREVAFRSSSVAFIVKSIGIKAATLVHKILSHTTMSFSNVVGPLEEVSLFGHPIAYLAPSVYGLPQALTIHFQSYVNKMTMVLAVDQNAIPNPHQLCDDLEESLNLIKDAIIARG